MNPFRRSLESGHFVVTAELTPPRGADMESLTAAVNTLRPAVSAVNLTDGAGARVRMSSLPAAIAVKQLGMEPIMQVTCRDRNRIALQSDLLGAAAFGIENVLVLGGDRVDAGDDPQAKAVFDLDSSGLLAALRHMSENATTLSGSRLSSAPTFFPGAADTPFDPAPDWAPAHLGTKIESGARFIQTQYCFDVELLGRYIARLRDHGLTESVFFLVGLGPLRSADAARFMRDKLWGTVMPDGIIRRMDAARDRRQEGIRICAELLQQVREIDGIAGAHLMAPGAHREIVDAVRLAGVIQAAPEGAASSPAS